MRSAPSSSFDDLADAYDRYRTGYAPEVYDVLADYGVRPGMHALDVACGTGLVAQALVAHDVRVTGIDLSEPMLAAARRRVPAATFVRGDAEALPFANDSFEAATSAQAYHWLDAEKALHETIRVVRPGGVVAVWWKELLRGDAIRLMREAAAREVGIVETSPSFSGEFEAFERSSLRDQRLRVIPWFVQTNAHDFIGYERSRARARETFGVRLEDYLAALGRRLGSPETPISLGYVHLLHLGRVSTGRG